MTDINRSVANEELHKAIHRSQHCQRNWDLDAVIPAEDLDTLRTAVTQCPSKQNVAFYKVHFIQDRETIEAVHQHTSGFVLENKQVVTNSQTLANLLVVFERHEDHTRGSGRRDDVYRNEQTATHSNPESQRILENDRLIALGIAAGYLNLTASLLGYSTGCCTCCDKPAIQELLGLSEKPMLLMGVGVRNDEMNRRVHHADHSVVFPTKQKQTIPFVAA